MLQNTGSGSTVTFNSTVPEWSNGGACKTLVRRFESDPYFHSRAPRTGSRESSRVRPPKSDKSGARGSQYVGECLPT